MVKNNSPFGLAVENWHFKVVEILMNEKRIKFQSENEKNPLQRACYNCNLKMVEILYTIESINKNELDDIFFLILIERCFQKFVLIHRNLLHLACMNGRHDIADYLISKGFDVNSKDKKEISFLF